MDLQLLAVSESEGRHCRLQLKTLDPSAFQDSKHMQISILHKIQTFQIWARWRAICNIPLICFNVNKGYISLAMALSAFHLFRAKHFHKLSGLWHLLLNWPMCFFQWILCSKSRPRHLAEFWIGIECFSRVNLIFSLFLCEEIKFAYRKQEAPVLNHIQCQLEALCREFCIGGAGKMSFLIEI